MATTYQGPATITYPGGRVAVLADLRVEWDTVEVGWGLWSERIRGRKYWLGTLLAESGEDLVDPLNAHAQGGALAVLLPNGQTGEFILRASNSDGRMEIEGHGRAPFFEDADDR